MTATPPYYREETLKVFFKYIKSGESFYIIGAPSAGKTRLMDFILGDDPDALRDGHETDRDWVKKKYLGEEVAAKTWLVRVDMNRMGHETDWGFQFYELLLHTVLLACNKLKATEKTEALKQELATLDVKVIQSKDPLMAHRLFEMAMNQICHSHNIQICFLFDEFDESYQTMPREVFAQLRAVRDANKYRLSYTLFLRNLPEKLRDPLDNESFYELISRNLLGLGPYSVQDTYHIIGQLEERREHELGLDKRKWLCESSGGHPGLTQALFVLLKDHSQAIAHLQDLDWFARQDLVHEEFRKLMAGLPKEEQAGLREIARGNSSAMSPETGRLLLAKGLVRPDGGRMVLFTPLFECWLLQ
ncbi:MAG: hypothetical protein PHQ36_05250 [Anaerolineales bacterium]|nr:hypothetical protein [Anaerolineales bacterium]